MKAQRNFLIAILSVVAISAGIYANTVKAEDETIKATTENVAEKIENVASEITPAKEAATSTKATTEVKTPDGLEVFPVLGLGDPDAPVYLVEYASLSCPGCASFHNNVLPRIKEEFIDTGKVYIEFREFPTSPSGLDASKLVRCMPEKRQYKFMDLLFKTQDQWAFTKDTTPLFQSAKLAGLNQDAIDACLANKDLENTILESIKNGKTTYSVGATPTVVSFPLKEKMKGLQNYKTVKKQIQRALKSAE